MFRSGFQFLRGRHFALQYASGDLWSLCLVALGTVAIMIGVPHAVKVVKDSQSSVAEAVVLGHIGRHPHVVEFSGNPNSSPHPGRLDLVFDFGPEHIP